MVRAVVDAERRGELRGEKLESYSVGVASWRGIYGIWSLDERTAPKGHGLRTSKRRANGQGTCRTGDK